MDIELDEILRAARGISTDTRTLEKGDCFIALKGARYDGHDFIRQALEKGARVIVHSQGIPGLSVRHSDARFIRVEDTLGALGELARQTRQKFRIPAVAVTGSAGKTTVKELIAYVLSERFQVLKNRGTENNLIGVPKTILQLQKEHEVLVLELGTSRPGEIQRLSGIAAPQIGVVTQIGHSHLQGLGTLEGVRDEKLALIREVEREGLVVLNGEDPLLKSVIGDVHKIIRVGFSGQTCDLEAHKVECHEEGSAFEVSGVSFETSLLGRHNVLNCLLAAAVARFLGLEFSAISKSLRGFKPVPGRLAAKQIEGIYFLDDTYNSNPSSFRAALETFGKLGAPPRKGVICGDMLELGARAQALHRELGALVAAGGFDFVIAAGELSKSLVDEALRRGYDAKRIFHVGDAGEAGRLCREIACPGDRILVKGSRGMKMEKVFECFITSSTL